MWCLGWFLGEHLRRNEQWMTFIAFPVDGSEIWPKTHLPTDVWGVFFVARVLNLHQYAQQQQGLKQETGGCNSNTLICVSNLGCGVRACMFLTEVLGRGIGRWSHEGNDFLAPALNNDVCRAWVPSLTLKRQTWQKFLHNTAFVSCFFWLSECAWH